MAFVHIKSPYALFQSQKRFVDLCAIHPGLLIGVDGVRPALVAREINEAKLTVLLTVVDDLNLQDRVRARGLLVRAGFSGDADLHAGLDHL